MGVNPRFIIIIFIITEIAPYLCYFYAIFQTTDERSYKKIACEVRALDTF